ncbi:10004_t:CDS:2 [Acaulospora morrowiae]|uniref:10004_t:CDS:1 n=1 Tax=Acaulospora morrowiae TaxID=94023 RepID=A0A9N9DS24_9GLOM|nr:10004_t:CDS:2 [Acaulospora morrowiae]
MAQSSNISRARYRRTVPLWERITSWPSDKLVELQEDWALKDWDKIEHNLSLPLSIFLNGLSIFLRLGLHPTRSSLAFWARILQWFEWSLFLLSIVNTMYVYSSSKKYHLFEREIKDRPNSPNAHLQLLGGIPPSWALGFPGNILFTLFRRFTSNIIRDERQCVWVLAMWEPPVLFLDIFCYYSPAQVLILHYLDWDNWRYILPAAAFIGLHVDMFIPQTGYLISSRAQQLTILVRAFQSLIKDKQTVFGEVYNEYNMKLVYPHLFVRKYEVSTQTVPVSGWTS